MIFFACNKDETPGDPRQLHTALRRYKYLALGDSYTIGQSVAVDARFPNKLHKY
jgi:hypothetical protein